MDIVTSLGLWNWIIVGCILLILELIVPGVFLIWLGFAALATAFVSGLIGEHLWLGTWQGEITIFLVFSVLFVVAGRRYFYKKSTSDEPLLNNRTDQLIGQIATLNEPIKNGHGRVRIDDTIWRVTGPDLPAGTKVRLAYFRNGAFEVDAINS